MGLTEHGVCSHAQDSRAKQGEEEKLLASFAGQITAFLKAREWVQKRKCAKRAAPQKCLRHGLEKRQFFWLWDLPCAGKALHPKNPVGAFHSDEAGRTLSVAREVKMEIAD